MKLKKIAASLALLTALHPFSALADTYVYRIPSSKLTVAPAQGQNPAPGKQDPLVDIWPNINKSAVAPSFAIAPPMSESDGAWAFTSSNPAVASISGSSVTIIGGGVSTITATQAATSAYNSASVTAYLVVSRLQPEIQDWAPMAVTLDVPVYTITPPDSNSDGAWAFESTNPTVATIEGDQLTLVGAGSTTILAYQAVTPRYDEASAGTTLVVSKATPVVGAWPNTAKLGSDSAFTLVPPASPSDGAWTYTTSTSGVATVNGVTGLVTLKAAGSTTVTATQAATDAYNGVSKAMTLTVTRATPTISAWANQAATTTTTTLALTPPTSNSGSAWTYASANTTVATVNHSSGLVTIVGPGTATITVTQGANSLFYSGTRSMSLTVTTP